MKIHRLSVPTVLFFMLGLTGSHTRASFDTHFFAMGLGFLQRDSLRVMNADQGILAPRTETTAPTLQFSYGFSSENFNWAPELVISLPKKDSIDGGTETSYLGLRLPVIEDWSWAGMGWNYSYGFSYFRYTMKGAGGTIPLTNLGTPTDYDLPSREVTTQFLTLDLGASYSFDPWSLGASLMTEKIFSNSKRSFSFLIDLKYNWK